MVIKVAVNFLDHYKSCKFFLDIVWLLIFNNFPKLRDNNKRKLKAKLGIYKEHN